MSFWLEFEVLAASKVGGMDPKRLGDLPNGAFVALRNIAAPCDLGRYRRTADVQGRTGPAAPVEIDPKLPSRRASNRNESIGTILALDEPRAWKRQMGTDQPLLARG